jgi:uncharacterized protein YhfF
MTMDLATPDWTALETFSFGDSPAMADRLLAFVLSGSKTATCWSVRDGQKTEVGKRMVVLDGADRPRAVIETTALEQVAFSQVRWDFALAEGEGDEHLEEWRQEHAAYFTRNGGFKSDMLLWCERFRLVEVIGEGAAA